MSRSRTRGRRRVARHQERVHEFTEARRDPSEFQALVARLAAGESSVWPVAEDSGRLSSLTDDERAVVAQAVAPALAASAAGAAKRRHAAARE